MITTAVQRVTSRALAICLTLAIVASLSARSSAAPRVISTTAGSGSIQINLPLVMNPMGITADATGSIYVAESGANRVRRIDPSGRATTIAGNTEAGFTGDGGPAREARLNSPKDVALDSSGNIYIADAGNARIRKVDTNGKITTIAGGGSGGDGPATSARLRTPWGLTVDGNGTVFFADKDDHKVRKVTASGTLTTLAGAGICAFFGDGGPAYYSRLCFPRDVALSTDGELFIADTDNNAIRVIYEDVIRTFVGGTIPGYTPDSPVLPKYMALFWPTQISIDAQGAIFFTDTGNQRVRKVTRNGEITTIAGNGIAFYTTTPNDAVLQSLRNPQGVAVTSSGVYVSDTDNLNIRKVVSKTMTVFMGGYVSGCDFYGDGGPAVAANICLPTDVAMGSSGSLMVTDRFNHRIRKVTTGGTISTFYGDGTKASLDTPTGLGTLGTDLYVAESGRGAIKKIDSTGTASMAWAPNPPRYPWDVAVAPNGDMYVSLHLEHRVLKVSPSGVVTLVAGIGTPGSGGDGGVGTSAELNSPRGLALSASGDLYIADSLNHKVRKVDVAGTITTLAGNGTKGFTGDFGAPTAASLSEPRGVWVDLSGRIFVADTDNNRIRLVSSGIIYTVAGSTAPSFMGPAFSGDQGMATAASIAYPSGVVTDAAGNVFIADTLNDRIRKVEGPV